MSESALDRVRRPEAMRVRTMGEYESGFELPAGKAGKPDWIDFRASVGRAERRIEVGEVVSRCWSCRTELDVAIPVHSPRCRTLVRESGRAALDAMDDGVPQRELAAADAAVADSRPQVEEPKPEEEVEAVSTNSGRAWTGESVVEAIQQWATEHDGKPPTQKDWVRSGEWWPSFSTAQSKFGTWGAAIAAAGFAKPSRGGNQGKRSLVREPKAREVAVVLTGTPPAASSSSPLPESDAAVVDESPSALVVEQAGSRTDEHDDEADGHHEWLLSLGLNGEMLRDEIARLDEVSSLSAQRRDALQEFLDALEAA